MHEIAWTRILSLVLGPTTYAFAATLAAVITGVAVGSGVGTWIVGRTRHPAAWLAFALAAAAVTASWTYSLAGRAHSDAGGAASGRARPTCSISCFAQRRLLDGRA